ncbi:MAG: structural cement protein Gp24 [Thiobacillus sp.]
MGFQQTVAINPAPAVAGQFASQNPRAAVLAGAGGLVAASGGLTIAAFAWIDSTGLIASNAGSGAPRGFVANETQGQIPFGSVSSMTINAGEPVTLFNEGDFWAVTTTAATPGQKIFASLTTGAIQTAATGTVITGYIETKFYAANTCAAGELVKFTSWY